MNHLNSVCCTMQVQPAQSRQNAAVWKASLSPFDDKITFAVSFSPEDGAKLVHEFISVFESGKSFTANSRLGIGRENLRVTHRGSLMLNSNGEFRPHVDKRRRLNVD